MNKVDELLKFLLDTNDYVSGEEIADHFNISRSAIWKMVRKLTEMGIKIDSKPNKGYKIIEEVNFINEASLNYYLNDDFFKIKVFKELPSSNTYIKEHDLEFDTGQVVFARTQTSGRGRLDRTFFSPLDTGLYFSILVKPNTLATSSIYLTVLAAVSVLEGINEALGIKLDIKWVNDLYKDGKKVVGILSEGSLNIDLARLNRCVIGIGINVSKPKEGFSNDLASIASYLVDDECNLNKIAASILKRFKVHYLEYLNNDYKFIDTYINNQLLVGKIVKSVNLATNESEIVKVLGVNKDCSLKVLKDNKEFNLLSGEVRLIMSNKKIGLTPRFNDDGVFEVNNNYINYLKDNGLSPVILDYKNDNIDEVIKSCDGFIICGGADLDPSFYGEENTDSTTTLKEIDLLDQKIVLYCKESNKPLIGVCRGMQAMNVFLGGSLYQNIPNHKDCDHYVNSTNPLFKKRFKVNSLHHQAINSLAKSLNVIGKSDDGIIEAVISDNGLMIGVQWHPEMRPIADESKQIMELFKKMLGE